MAENSSALRVLIVDDEPLIRWSMAETLAHAGHIVAEAGTREQALDHLASGDAPHVVLLDYRLPDSNDLTLLEAIRHAAPASAVIMMTAFGTADVVAGALQRGAFRVMTKPVEMAELEDLVREAHAAHGAGA